MDPNWRTQKVLENSLKMNLKTPWKGFVMICGTHASQARHTCRSSWQSTGWYFISLFSVVYTKYIKTSYLMFINVLICKILKLWQTYKILSEPLSVAPTAHQIIARPGSFSLQFLFFVMSQKELPRLNRTYDPVFNLRGLFCIIRGIKW